MNIKELKKLIKKLPDDMEVCGVGHYGEILSIFSGSCKEVKEYITSCLSFRAFVLDIANKSPKLG